MPVIKRYANRKLYDTEAKQYVSLDGIAERIRQGEDVRVVDHTTGEDLTALTLTQIILEQQKKGGTLLPGVTLARLIRSGSDRLNSLRRTLTAPIDASRYVDEEISRRLQNLVADGRVTEPEAERMRGLLIAQPQPPSSPPWSLDREIEHVLSSRGVPTRSELRKLTRQLDDLSAELDKLR